MNARMLGMVAASIALGAATAVGLSRGATDAVDHPYPPKVFVDPDRGLSDEEKDAKYRAASEAYFRQFAEWLRAFDLAKVDVRPLARAEILDSLPPPSEGLKSAVAAADAIVDGDVVSTSFGTLAGAAVTTVRVRTLLKGQPVATEITILQPGGPEPRGDWSFEKAVIGESPASPLLLPGDRAILFLQNADGPANYTVQAGSGHYRVVDARVRPTERNPFGGGIVGKSVTEFEQLLRDAIR